MDGVGTRYTVRTHNRAPSWAEQPERTPRLGSSTRANCPVLAAQVETLDGARRWACNGIHGDGSYK